jgi:hypothetical protein
MIHTNGAAAIYDLQGRLVLTIAAAGTWTIDLPAGTYAVIGQTSAGQATDTPRLIVR